MNKQKEFNLEKMGVADLVKPLNEVELIEVEGGREHHLLPCFVFTKYIMVR